MVYKTNWLARQGKKWTERDMTQLLDLYAAGTRWGVIAQELQRSIPSCVDRLRALRFYHGFKQVFKHKSETYSYSKLEIKGRSDNG
jgi:hypothetical protein